MESSRRVIICSVKYLQLCTHSGGSPVGASDGDEVHSAEQVVVGPHPALPLAQHAAPVPVPPPSITCHASATLSSDSLPGRPANLKYIVCGGDGWQDAPPAALLGVLLLLQPDEGGERQAGRARGHQAQRVAQLTGLRHQHRPHATHILACSYSKPTIGHQISESGRQPSPLWAALVREVVSLLTLGLEPVVLCESVQQQPEEGRGLEREEEDLAGRRPLQGHGGLEGGLQGGRAGVQ